MVSRFDNIDLSEVQGVLLDLDDTLYTYKPCHETALNKCCKEFLSIEKDITEEEFFSLYQSARKKIGADLAGQAASHSRLLYFQKAFENFYGHTHYAFTLKFEEIYWSTFLDCMQLTIEAEDFLKKCKERKIDICLVTDLTAQIQHKKINRLNISKYIKFMVSSEEAGTEKPDKKIFDLALSKLSLKVSQAIMIGDSIEKDIKGATLSDIKSYQIKA